MRQGPAMRRTASLLLLVVMVGLPAASAENPFDGLPVKIAILTDEPIPSPPDPVTCVREAVGDYLVWLEHHVPPYPPPTPDEVIAATTSLVEEVIECLGLSGFVALCVDGAGSNWLVPTWDNPQHIVSDGTWFAEVPYGEYHGGGPIVEMRLQIRYDGSGAFCPEGARGLFG